MLITNCRHSPSGRRSNDQFSILSVIVSIGQAIEIREPRRKEWKSDHNKQEKLRGAGATPGVGACFCTASLHCYSTRDRQLCSRFRPVRLLLIRIRPLPSSGSLALLPAARAFLSQDVCCYVTCAHKALRLGEASWTIRTITLGAQARVVREARTAAMINQQSSRGCFFPRKSQKTKKRKKRKNIALPPICLPPLQP
jgi:hypothetical protein